MVCQSRKSFEETGLINEEFNKQLWNCDEFAFFLCKRILCKEEKERYMKQLEVVAENT